MGDIQAPLPFKAMSVANKSASSVQISAEQLLREATDRGSLKPQTQQRIVDSEEMGEFRARKRKEYEDKLRSQRQHMSTWIQYATWEADQKEFTRARSVFERALDVEYQNTGIWQKYVEMEKKNQFISHVRNLLERVTKVLPRESRFWLEYTLIEETQENYSGCRAIFERWLAVKPELKAYRSYARFEMRCHERDRANAIMLRMVEDKGGEEAIKLCIEFQVKHEFVQVERLRPTEKKIAALEAEVLQTWRARYQEEIAANPRHYDVWFDYLRLEEANGTNDDVVAAYERAVANVPPVAKKEFWRRYIYLWLYYCIFLELKVGDIPKAREAIRGMIEVVPHKKFSFKKVWKYAAEFEIRNGSIQDARKVLGTGLGKAGQVKPSLYPLYGGLELRLGNLDRARTIYARCIETHPSDPTSWIAAIELEVVSGDIDRARYFCSKATEVEDITVPEAIWKKFIELELSQGELNNARALYEKLLEMSDHFQVFKAYSDFEYQHALSIENARTIVERGLESMKLKGDDHSREALLKHLLFVEKENGDEDAIEKVWKRQAKHSKSPSGEDVIAFPDDGAAKDQMSGLSILQKAKAWKEQQEGATGGV